MYVLDPVLAAGKKLPRWQPRSRRGMFVGFSPVHSSDVPLILNLRTGHISPQYHVVFDDDFSTVQSIPEGNDPPPWWNEINLEENTLRIPLDDDATLLLDKDWLSPEELEERSRRNIRQTQLRQAFNPTTSLPDATLLSPLPPTTTPPITSTLVPPASTVGNSEKSVTFKGSLKTPTVISNQANVEPPPSPSLPPIPASSTSPRRSTRNTKGSRQSTRFVDEAYLASVVAPESPDSTNAKLAYLAEVSTDFDTGIIDCSDPRAYAAKFKTYTLDNPSFNMAMSGKNSHE